MPRPRAKSQPVPAGATHVDPPKWSASHGMYVAGRAHIDEADAIAIEMEAKWGADRLRLLVGPELREKFDRQRHLFNHALWHGQLEDVRREAARMATGWRVLDRAATEAGKTPLDPQVWEVALADGTVAAIVPDNHHANRVQTEGRRVVVYTLEEIAKLIGEAAMVSAVKLQFPGATVTQVKRHIVDPLFGSREIERDFDDAIPF